MKKSLLFFAILFISISIKAQLNTVLRSDVQFASGDLNDVWGWHHAATNKEYALVGRTVGVSVIDVTDPDNPVDVGFVSGVNSSWRDIKTWGDYAYVTNESGDGIAVIYLGNLPSGGALTSFNWTPDLTADGLGALTTCHNIYIDENGYAYLAGCNLNSGGMLIVDVFTTPGSPTFVSAAPAIYSHDVYVRNNKMYGSEIYAGVFTIYDVTDKNNIFSLGAHPTPFDFTHNAWPTDDDNFLFTTDEKANAPIGSYDISDPTDIQEVDQFIPLATEGDGVIPHNVHVWNDYIIASYYTDGGVIIDASEPHNLIEVGNFDTFTGAGAGFSGTWGAYPFLPSGTILLTDIGNGLYIVSPTYVRACRVEGTITDINTAAAIAGATVTIDAPQINNGTSNSTGEYKTGIATAGTYDVTFSAPGYASQTISLVLTNGTTIMQDVALGELVSYSLSGQTIQAANGSALKNAEVYIYNEEYSFTTTSDASGSFSLPAVYGGDYTAAVFKWGYMHGTTTFNLSSNGIVDNPIIIEAEVGYQDDFQADLNWTTSNSATAGFWELGEPVGTNFNGAISNPEADLTTDIGSKAYVTGNGGGGAGADDVDGGTVTLTSPVMDMTTFTNPKVVYNAWFYNAGGSTAADDSFVIKINNGTVEVVLETITTSSSVWRARSEFELTGLIPITNTMQLIAETSDIGSGHLVEAGLDAFRANSALLLPAELINFTAKQREDKVLLEWQTSLEINNLGFEIERSQDAQDWQKIGFVAGKGISNVKQDYSYLDNNPNEGINYYRLRQLDEDGNFDFSKIVKVEIKSRFLEIASISPNPVVSYAQISLVIQEAGMLNFQLFDVIGRLVLEKEYNLEGGANTLSVSMEELASGIYFMEFRSGGEVFDFKIVKE